PSKALLPVLKIINKYKIELIISNNRLTKLGDYTSPIKEKGHIITINGSLNKYNFLITFLHEFAHLKNWLLFKDKIYPHGKEWKKEFSKVIKPYIYTYNVFPKKIKLPLLDYLTDPASTIYFHEFLTRAIKEFDKKPKSVLLEDVPDNGIFKTENGEIFKKGALLRSRYRCLLVPKRRVYLLDALTEVRRTRGGEKGV
ncbi:MAG: hypothetical protein A3H98_06020, partial [Bacteroidetes bacterium RIFCSPLOWO2_02_FULL_36_8]